MKYVQWTNSGKDENDMEKGLMFERHLTDEEVEVKKRDKKTVNQFRIVI